MRHFVVFLLFVAFTLISCDSDKAESQGTKGNECYPNGTCNDGLECLSGVCVDPDEQGYPDKDAPVTDNAVTDDTLPDDAVTDTETPDNTVIDDIVPDVDTATRACIDDEMKCIGNVLWRCSNKNWYFEVDCMDIGKFCMDKSSNGIQRAECQ